MFRAVVDSHIVEVVLPYRELMLYWQEAGDKVTEKHQET